MNLRTRLDGDTIALSPPSVSHKSDFLYSFRKPDTQTFLSSRNKFIRCLQKTLPFHIPGYLLGINLAGPEVFCKKHLPPLRWALQPQSITGNKSRRAERLLMRMTSVSDFMGCLCYKRQRADYHGPHKRMWYSSCAGQNLLQRGVEYSQKLTHNTQTSLTDKTQNLTVLNWNWRRAAEKWWWYLTKMWRQASLRPTQHKSSGKSPKCKGLEFPWEDLPSWPLGAPPPPEALCPPGGAHKPSALAGGRFKDFVPIQLPNVEVFQTEINCIHQVRHLSLITVGCQSTQKAQTWACPRPLPALVVTQGWFCPQTERACKVSSGASNKHLQHDQHAGNELGLRKSGFAIFH